MRGRMPAAVLLVLWASILAACGSGAEGPGDALALRIIFPEGWETRLDSQALPAPAATPYIGTLRFTAVGNGGAISRDYPYEDRAAAFTAASLSDLDQITVEALAGGRVIMAGSAGRPFGSVVDLPLQEAGGFAAAGSLSVHRRHHAAVAAGDAVFVIGGAGDSRLIETVQVSAGAPVIAAFAASLNYSRDKTEALYDPAGGRIFVFKGSSQVEDNVYEIVDVAGGTCSAQLLADYRTGYFPALYEDNIYLIGGYDDGNNWLINSHVINFSSNTIYEYLDTDLVLSPFRDDTNCSAISGYLVCIAGISEGNYLDDIHTFDMQSATPIGVLRISHSRTDFTANVESQSLIAIGGINSGGYLSEVETYTPASGTVVDLGSLLILPRARHTSTVLEDKKILVIGGGPTLDASQTAEIVDLKARTSTLVPWKLRVPRNGHTATLLPDGRVLVVGGNMGDRTVEIFNPLPD